MTTPTQAEIETARSISASRYEEIAQILAAARESVEREAQGIVEALEKISNMRCPDLSDNMTERTMELGGLWAACLIAAKEALAAWRERHPK